MGKVIKIQLDNGIDVDIDDWDLPYPASREDPGMALSITSYEMFLDGLDVPDDFARQIFDKCEDEIYKGLEDGLSNERD